MTDTDLFGTSERSAAVDALHAMTALYTVAPVVDDLLDHIGWPDADGRLLDPSAGDAMFVVRALHRLNLAPNDINSAQRVLGWEIHPHAVAAGRTRITEYLTDAGWDPHLASHTARKILTEADFLLEKPTGQFRFIAGNPPFAAFRNLPHYFKETYSAVLDQRVRADLLHAFLDRCVSMMPAPLGAIAMITSDRWLMNSTASHLREHLGTRAGIKHLERLDPTTAFYRPKNRKKGTAPRIHPVAVVLSPRQPGHIHLTERPMSPDGTLDTWEGPRLEDVATLRLAPWLGPAGIFTIPSKYAHTLPHADLLPCVDSSNIEPEVDELRPPSWHAIRTTRHSEPEGAVADYIRAGLHKMPARGRSKHWWTPPEPINLDLSRDAIIIPRIARRVRCINLPAGVLPLDHNIHVATCKDGFSLDAIRAALQRQETQTWINAFAPRLENGFFDLRLSMLRKIPIHR
ncbi:hypothetical protein GCM10019059_37990 [Camelimonas fluminis]|uniref:site-specific DNA-methyltransferase (adenine-specific) n=1 Tax=Camelimonas fluminis TaxID=1576911 RepID=A0ABV7UB05_9HYPH|nr:SAM-dependent methyltransferase [Camelimonas fluminis]GHE74912.1 hypothetical protein GCM10019059_37990 [Camelimonas fluminis]